jgi:hypothetical protein
LPHSRFQAVGALEGQHPARIFRWQGADFVELFELVWCELDVYGGDVVLELLDSLGTDDHAGYDWFGEQLR